RARRPRAGYPPEDWPVGTTSHLSDRTGEIPAPNSRSAREDPGSSSPAGGRRPRSWRGPPRRGGGDLAQPSVIGPDREPLIVDITMLVAPLLHPGRNLVIFFAADGNKAD